MSLAHFFFFNDTATTEIYTLSLHDALPIFARPGGGQDVVLEHPDVRHADRATVEHGGDARLHPADVRRDTAHPDAFGLGAVRDVGVQVDQTRCDVAVVILNLQGAPGVARGDV